VIFRELALGGNKFHHKIYGSTHVAGFPFAGVGCTKIREIVDVLFRDTRGRLRMKYIKILVVVISLAVCTMGWAEDETPTQPKVKGLDLATDVVGDVTNKAGALLRGDLVITMEPGTDPALKKDEYTYNALGQKVPKKTAIKTGRALHN